VPLNVFGPTAASAEAINYVMQPTHYAADTTMDALSGQIAGSPFSTWAGPVNVACRANGES
jgi:iron complex outermembrane receptor protein